MADPWVVCIPQSQADDLRAKGVPIDPSWEIVPDGPIGDRVREILAFPPEERLSAYHARALREWEAQEAHPPVILCACDDFMVCEHPYPAILRMPRPAFLA